jgi:hypothetical protein
MPRETQRAPRVETRSVLPGEAFADRRHGTCYGHIVWRRVMGPRASRSKCHGGDGIYGCGASGRLLGSAN